MKKKKYAAGGDLQSPNGLDMLSMGLSLVPGWGQIASPAMGLISGLVKKQQAEKELRNTVITGTPGNFASGGSVAPVSLPSSSVQRGRKKRSNIDYGNLLAPLMGFAGAGLGLGMLAKNAKGTTTPPLGTQAIPAINMQEMQTMFTAMTQTPFTPQESLRQNPYTGTAQQETPPWAVVYDPLEQKGQMTMAAQGGSLRRNKVAGLANGGDIPLSSGSFQVKGNPGTTDGNTYDYKGAPIALDHNEVVDTQKDFVFSDDITNPMTDKSFAKDAAKLQRATGKAEKAAIMHNSAEAKNTLKYHEQARSSLASLQELMKSVSSKVVEGRPGTRGFAAGGPLPWDGFGVKEFQQFANEQGYVDPITGKPIGVDNAWGPQSQGAFAKLGDAWAGQLGLTNNNGTYTRNAPLNIVNNPQGMSVPNPANSSQFASWNANRPNWQGPPPVQNIPQYMTTPDGEQVDISELGGTNTPTPQTANQRAAATTPFVSQSGEEFPMTEVPPGTSTQAGNLKKGIGKGAIGDSLQGMEVLSKFFETMQPAEVQKPYLDNTQITKQAYDARPALAQNDRNYQNSMASLSTPSINLRRALSSNMYATKLNADQQTVTQYDSMNKQARTQYEGAISNRLRYNNQQSSIAEEGNQRNRAQKDQAIQNAFTSLGNYGEALNRKDQSYSSLALLKELYPDVYDRIINQYNTKTTVKVK